MKTKRKTQPEQTTYSLDQLNAAAHEAGARGYSIGEKHGYTRGFEVGTAQVCRAKIAGNAGRIQQAHQRAGRISTGKSVRCAIMSVIQTQTLDQVQGVDTDAAFSQTAAKLSSESANYCACDPATNYVCDACAEKIEAGAEFVATCAMAKQVIDKFAPEVFGAQVGNIDRGDNSAISADETPLAVTPKKPRKPRQPKKPDPVQIAESIQETLFLGRKAATDKIKKRLLLPTDYEEAFWHLHAVTTEVLQKTVAICGNSINHLLDIQASQAKELQDGDE